MLTKPVTKNGPPLLRASEAREDEQFRKLALRQLERVRNFKLHLAAFLVGMSSLTGA